MTTELATTGEPPRRIVAALALAPEARAVLAERSGAELVDIRDAGGDEDLVLAPAVSWQLIGRLRRAFPEARVLVVEVEDEAAGAAFAGPVMRAMQAGADGYYVGGSLSGLGEFLRAGAPRATWAGPVAVGPGVEDELGAVVDDMLRRRTSAGGSGGGRVG
jgi:hypothetical protein